MGNQIMGALNMGYAPVSTTYTSTTSPTVPSNASQLVVSAVGRGGGGAERPTSYGAGGGGGAYSTKTFAVAAGDYGKAIAITIPGSGAITVVGSATGVNITNSTLNLSVGAGADAAGVVVGAGGTATGGSTNTAGSAGVGTTGGAGGAPDGAAGGAAGENGGNPGGGGGGGNQEDVILSGNPGPPRVVLSWA